MQVQRSYAKHEVGTLYLVGTPIGNLEDITFRAVRTLREADIIAAEDTRQTRKLLTHYDITGKLISYHEHNKMSSGPALIAQLLSGHSVALVSDAGMPAISDPGEQLVKLAVEVGIPVVPIPGASASLCALIASGLSTARFRFVGFLPREKKKLREALTEMRPGSDTLVIYESPHRLQATLRAMLDVLGDRRMALVRELTKRYEEAARGTISELLAFVEEHPPKGEYCLVVEGNVGETDTEQSEWWTGLSIAEHVAGYEARELPRKDAMKRAAADRGVSKRDIYRELLE